MILRRNPFKIGHFLALSLTLALFAAPALAQVPKAEQQCINELNKNLAKVAKTQGKDICSCIKDGSKEKLSGQTIEQCTTADNKGKVGKAKARAHRRGHRDEPVLPRLRQPMELVSPGDASQTRQARACHARILVAHGFAHDTRDRICCQCHRSFALEVAGRASIAEITSFAARGSEVLLPP